MATFLIQILTGGDFKIFFAEEILLDNKGIRVQNPYFLTTLPGM